MTLAGTLNACLASQCESECGLACGALSQIAPPDAAPACEVCLQAANYCAAAEKCSRSEPCQSYLLCRQNCTTGECVGACLGIDPTANSFFHFFTEIQPGCSSACDVGKNWACVDRFTRWAVTAASTRNLTLSLADSITGAPLAGVNVSMCEPSPADIMWAPAPGATGTRCAVPVSSKQTDSQGGVTLSDSTINGLSHGLNGFLALDSPDLYPTLFYWGYPLGMPNGVIADPIRVFSLEDWSYAWSSLWQNVATPDPARGVIIGGTLDCFGIPAPGVAVALSGSDQGGSMPYYLRSGSNSLMGGADALTDTTGTFVFANVSPGAVDVIATPQDLGRPSSRVAVVVRAGTVTEVALRPTPQPGEVLDAGVE